MECKEDWDVTSKEWQAASTLANLNDVWQGARNLLKIRNDFPPHLRPVMRPECRQRPFKKVLTDTDMGHNNTLVLAGRYVERKVVPMLNGKELYDMETTDGAAVAVVDRSGRRFSLQLKFRGRMPVLFGWKSFAGAHGLVARKCRVKVWFYRLIDSDDLCAHIVYKNDEYRVPHYDY